MFQGSKVVKPEQNLAGLDISRSWTKINHLHCFGETFIMGPLDEECRVTFSMAHHVFRHNHRPKQIIYNV